MLGVFSFADPRPHVSPTPCIVFKHLCIARHFKANTLATASPCLVHVQPRQRRSTFSSFSFRIHFKRMMSRISFILVSLTNVTSYLKADFHSRFHSMFVGSIRTSVQCVNGNNHWVRFRFIPKHLKRERLRSASHQGFQKQVAFYA